MDIFDIKDKVAIVTGTNSGVGQAIAKAYLNAGAKVLGVSIDDGCASNSNFNKNFVEYPADLIKQDGVDDIVQKCVDRFGRVDILVNNAGTIRRDDAINFCEKDWDDVLNINLKTVFFLSQAVAKQFIKQKKPGKIINVSSVLSFQGGTRVASYSASKAAIQGLTKGLANEWAVHNININAIVLGYFETANTASFRSDPNTNKSILDRIPQSRWGIPDDTVGTAIFLASHASDYVNGSAIVVDGGWSTR